MSEPEADWIDGIIPPARHWRVVYRYLGLADAVLHPSADACFAANAVCRRVYSRYPVDSAFHYRPLTKFDPGPLCPDLDADGDAGHGSDPDAIPDAHADPLRGNAAGGTGDGNSGGGPGLVRADNRDAGRDARLLLDGSVAHTDVDPDLAAVPDARANDAVHEGRVGV